MSRTPSEGFKRLVELNKGRAFAREETWFTLIYGYAPADQAFRCPDLRNSKFSNSSKNHDKWLFDAHSIGYGQNSYFLGQMPGRAKEQSGRLPCGYEVKLATVRSPADCINLADSEQKNGGHWSLTLWWPFINRANEGWRVIGTGIRPRWRLRTGTCSRTATRIARSIRSRITPRSTSKTGIRSSVATRFRDFFGGGLALIEEG